MNPHADETMGEDNEKAMEQGEDLNGNVSNEVNGENEVNQEQAEQVGQEPKAEEETHVGEPKDQVQQEAHVELVEEQTMQDVQAGQAGDIEKAVTMQRDGVMDTLQETLPINQDSQDM
jgi:hypothetical protein